METNIIGYKKQGESILFFIKADGKICYSGLIDCYSTSNLNIVDKLLKENEVKCLDFICWTHPDADHSNGFEVIFNKYVDSYTLIWIPEYSMMKDELCSIGARHLFDELKKCLRSRNQKYNVYTTSDYKDLLYYGKSIEFRHGVTNYSLSIKSYTPNSNHLNRQYVDNVFIKNDCSIMLAVELGNVVELFTGDIENPTIEDLPENVYFDLLHVLKIPHHGSSTSDRLFDHFTKCDVSCSTVYRNGKVNLPSTGILDQYVKVSDRVYCTGSIDGTNENQEYGVVRIETNILQNTSNVKLVGNAAFYNSNIASIT